MAKATNHGKETEMARYTKAQLIDQAAWYGLYGQCVSKAKAARIIDVSRSSIYNMIDDGRLVVWKNGKVSVQSLWAWAKTGKQRRTSCTA